MASAGPALHFRIRGMDCAEEVALLKHAVGPVVGGEARLAFDILSGKMTVQTPAAGTTPEAIHPGCRADRNAGGSLAGHPAVLADGTFWQRHGRTVATVFSGLCVTIGLWSTWS